MKTNYQSGHDAEQQVAEYLESLGYQIVDINWKTRYCEIDVVASRDRVLFFVEVKSRRSGNYGTGLDYITPKKQKQMKFAADMYVQSSDWSGDYRLAAASVDGDKITFIDQL